MVLGEVIERGGERERAVTKVGSCILRTHVPWVARERTSEKFEIGRHQCYVLGGAIRGGVGSVEHQQILKSWGDVTSRVDKRRKAEYSRDCPSDAAIHSPWFSFAAVVNSL